MSIEKRLDILVPAFNASKTIERSLESLLDQTYRNIRVMVVNDGSTDSTGAIIQRLADRDPRIFFINQPNGGIVAALNNALTFSETELVARHDADDISYSERLTQQIAYLDANPDCVAVSANARQIDQDDMTIGMTHLHGDAKPNAEVIPSVEPYLMHPFLVARRNVVNAVGGYRYSFHSEDSDLYWRLLRYGRLHNMSCVVGDYRIHKGGITSASVKNGRIGAVYSQLATLSYLRRRKGLADIEFPSSSRDSLEKLDTLSEIVEFAGAQLSGDEREHLRLASAAKLLENATYRDYLLDQADCDYIAYYLPRVLSIVPPLQVKKIESQRVTVARRLLKARRLREMRQLQLPTLDYSRLAWQPIAKKLNLLRGRGQF